MHGLAVIFLARLERPFLTRISHLAGVQDENFLFSHNPLRDLARPNSRDVGFLEIEKVLPLPHECRASAFFSIFFTPHSSQPN